MESQSRPTPWKCQVVKVKTSPSLLIYLVCSNTKCDSFKANFTECKSKCLWLPQYVNKFLVWHNKFGAAQNILGPLKGLIHYILNFQVWCCDWLFSQKILEQAFWIKWRYETSSFWTRLECWLKCPNWSRFDNITLWKILFFQWYVPMYFFSISSTPCLIFCIHRTLLRYLP